MQKARPQAPLPGLRLAPDQEAQLFHIDDHARCRNGLSDLLTQRGGMEVLAALSNPEQVLAVLREQRPDLVVLDLRMPETDGAEQASDAGADAGFGPALEPGQLFAQAHDLADDRQAR